MENIIQMLIPSDYRYLNVRLRQLASPERTTGKD